VGYVSGWPAEIEFCLIEEWGSFISDVSDRKVETSSSDLLESGALAL